MGKGARSNDCVEGVVDYRYSYCFYNCNGYLVAFFANDNMALICGVRDAQCGSASYHQHRGQAGLAPASRPTTRCRLLSPCGCTPI
jgi:hypothetical protein